MALRRTQSVRIPYKGSHYIAEGEGDKECIEVSHLYCECGNDVFELLDEREHKHIDALAVENWEADEDDNYDPADN